MARVWAYMTQIERYEAYHELQDKLRRRNLQIKDLKKKLKLYEGNEQTYKDFKRCSD